MILQNTINYRLGFIEHVYLTNVVKKKTKFFFVLNHIPLISDFYG